MKALILAAGYATRLRPLTNRYPKELLPLAGRPIVDMILDRIAAVSAVDEIHLVTNASKAPMFAAWSPTHDVKIHNDGTTSNEDRLGAIGDITFVVDHEGWETEDILVVAGDNLFDFSLADYVSFWSEREGASAVALYEHPERDLLSQYGIVEVDAAGRLVNFVEKPEHPPSNLVSTATYIYGRAHVSLLHAYAADAQPMDAPGNFIAWLYKRAPVYGYRFRGEWLDIGNQSQLLEADNRLRARAGLPLRTEYRLED